MPETDDTMGVARFIEAMKEGREGAGYTSPLKVLDAPVRDLHNAREAKRPIERERFVHRMVAYLTLQGLTQKEIADKVSLAPATISNIQRQPWFRELVNHEIALFGRDAAQEILRGAAVDSVLTLIELRDDKNTPASVRRQSASEILDRVYGKATLNVHHHDSKQGDAAKTAKELEREISMLVEEDRGLKNLVTKEAAAPLTA